MKYIKLTQGKEVIVDDEDYEFLSQFKWYYNKGYAVRGASPKILMHRVINKTKDGYDTDHINRNTLDNRKENLRTATRTENQINKNLQKNNTSGYKGVSWHKRINAWSVIVNYKKQQLHCGYYNDLEKAIMAHKKVNQWFHGDFSFDKSNGGLSLK